MKKCLEIPQSDLMAFLSCVLMNDRNESVILESSMPYKSLGMIMLFAIVEMVAGCVHLIPDEIRYDVVVYKSATRECMCLFSVRSFP